MSDPNPTDDFLPPDLLQQLQRVVDTDPKQIGNFLIESRLGEGGFGTVYRAVQQEPVQRTVAIKLLKRGMDSHAVLQRFELERHALAKMNHPGIAQVFDAGISEDGQQFIVMEYVAGTTIVQWADDHRLNVHERLKLFSQVCDAVAHAHQKGIIHRDLKPSNVLVTQVGKRAQIKVIDFGIAKAIGGDTAEEEQITREPMWIGTPEYMSPEQAGAENHVIDTRTDTYALGVMLYELLTGQLPFTRKELRRAAHQEVLRVIREQDPPKPSTRLSGVDRMSAELIANQRGMPTEALIRKLKSELEWIPLKAIRKEPAHRYQTAEQFAEDIANYLGGQPLLAGPESASYRLKKFVVRHRWQVAASCVLLASLIAGTIGTSVMAARAVRQRKLAESRLNDVRQLASTFMFDLYPKIRNLPGSTPAIQALVETSLTYLNKLEQSAKLDAHDDLWLDIATAYNRVAVIQGTPGQNNLGDVEGAAANYHKALEIAERWLATDPANRQAANARLTSLSGIAAIEGRRGNIDQAIQLTERETQLAAELFASSGDRDALREVFIAHFSLGDFWFQRGNLAESRTAFEAAVASLEQSPLTGGDDQLQIDLAFGYSRLGQLKAKMGEREEAEKDHRTAVDTLQAAQQASPDDSSVLRAAAFARDQLARFLIQTDRSEAATQVFEDNVSIFSQLCEIDPASAQLRRDLGVARQRLADMLLQQERFEEALNCLNIAIKDNDELLKISPTYENRRLKSVFLGRLARTYHSSGDFEEAVRWHHEVIKSREALHQERPDNHQNKQELAFAWDKLSVTLVNLERWEDALAALEKALMLREQLLKEAPDRDRSTQRVANNLVSIGKVLLKLDRPAEARERLHSAVTLRRDLLQQAPEDADLQSGLADSLKELGDGLRQAGDPAALAEATSAYQEARNILESLQQAGELMPDELELLDEIIDAAEGSREVPP